MKYKNIIEYEDDKFRRITGVKRKTFDKMLDILRPIKNGLTSKGGPKPKLSLEDMLLMMLEYLREYRTYAHVSVSYGISESSAFRIIKWIEDVLIKDGTFSLPGKKELLKKDNNIEIILIDATETPIERPKKNKNIGIQEKRNAIQ